MLDPEERRLLSDLLEPPEDHVFDEAVICTYSLDLLALAGVPLALMNLEPRLDDDDAAARVAAIESVRRFASRLTVVCQAGAIHVPGAYRDAFLWLERAVVQVTPHAERAVFHPKLWLLRYRADAGVRYRLIVLSRNLTFDRSWDVATSLEGPLTARQNAIGANSPMVDFVQALGGDAVPFVGQVAGDHTERLARFARELGRVKFETADKDIEAWSFWPIGIPKHTYEARKLFAGRRSPFKSFADASRQRSGRRLLVISPFLSAGMVESLKDVPFDTRLVSRQLALDDICDGLPAAWMLPEQPRVYEFLDALSDGSSALSGLHAKLWIADDGRTAHVWIGSANATDAAFGRNVEFLLQITGPRSRIGIEATLGRDVRLGSMAPLLCPYRAPDARTEEEEAALEHRRRERELGWRLTTLLAEERFRASVERCDGAWTLALCRKGNEPIVMNGHTVAWHARPITLASERADAGRCEEDQCIKYTGLAQHELTFFWCVELLQDDIRVRATARIEPAGEMPAFASREAAVISRHLQDARSLGLYIEFLLAGADADFAGRLRAWRRRERGRGAAARNSARPLFETLLQALAIHPEALSRVMELLERADTAASDLAGQGDFIEIWRAVREARSLLEAAT